MTKYEFHWSIAPDVLVGRQTKERIGRFEFEIGTDRIVARTEFTDAPKSDLRAEAAAIVSNLARAIAFQEKRQVTPALGNVTCTSDSGSADIELSTSVSMVIAVEKVRVAVHGPDGALVFSSEEQEFQQIKMLADRAARSVPLQQMLDHIQVFYGDPTKKLAPLYDILQIAETQFRGRDGIAAALAIPTKDLERLGRITNDVGILNARHPGSGSGPKRAATTEEIAFCERVAETIIRTFAESV